MGAVNRYEDVTRALLHYLNYGEFKERFILEGRSALKICYGLGIERAYLRISSLRVDYHIVSEAIKSVCKLNNYKYKVEDKSVHGVDFLIYYDDIHPLFIRVVYRDKQEGLGSIVCKNGVTTYDINYLLSGRLEDFEEDEASEVDIYELCFVYKQYKDQLSDENILLLRDKLNLVGHTHLLEIANNSTGYNITDKNEFISGLKDVMSELGI